MITPRSSDAAVRFLKLCFKKSKRAPTAASGSVAVTCTDDSERQTSGRGCTFMRISAAATVQLSAIASRSAK